MQNAFDLSEFKAVYLPPIHVKAHLTGSFPLLSSASFPPCLISAWLKMRNVLVEFILSLKKSKKKKRE